MAAPYAHPAAVLLLSGRLWPVGLVAGSLAPDLAYLLSVPATLSHQGPSFMPVGVAVAALAALWWTALVVPVVGPLVGKGPWIDWSRIVCAPAAPRWQVCLLSFLIGVASHVLWDGLTHAAWWPARMLAEVTLAGIALPLLLWKWTSYVGAIALALFLARRFPARRPLAWKLSREIYLALLLTLSGAVSGFVHALEDPADPSRTWNATISALRVGLGVATLYLVAKRSATRCRCATFTGP